jgi:hypothetical protein
MIPHNFSVKVKETVWRMSKDFRRRLSKVSFSVSLR